MALELLCNPASTLAITERPLMSTQIEPFDFDEWKNLAENNLQAFEARRREVIEGKIRHAPQSVQRRLRGLQWRIDLIRARYRDPMVSSAKLFDMMWQSVYGKDGFLQALSAPLPPAGIPARAGARVIDLRDRRQQRKTS